MTQTRDKDDHDHDHPIHNNNNNRSLVVTLSRRWILTWVLLAILTGYLTGRYSSSRDRNMHMHPVVMDKMDQNLLLLQQLQLERSRMEYLELLWQGRGMLLSKKDHDDNNNDDNDNDNDDNNDETTPHSSSRKWNQEQEEALQRLIHSIVTKLDDDNNNDNNSIIVSWSHCHTTTNNNNMMMIVRCSALLQQQQSHGTGHVHAVLAVPYHHMDMNMNMNMDMNTTLWIQIALGGGRSTDSADNINDNVATISSSRLLKNLTTTTRSLLVDSFFTSLQQQQNLRFLWSYQIRGGKTPKIRLPVSDLEAWLSMFSIEKKILFPPPLHHHQDNNNNKPERNMIITLQVGGDTPPPPAVAAVGENKNENTTTTTTTTPIKVEIPVQDMTTTTTTTTTTTFTTDIMNATRQSQSQSQSQSSSSAPYLLHFEATSGRLQSTSTTTSNYNHNYYYDYYYESLILPVMTMSMSSLRDQRAERVLVLTTITTTSTTTTSTEQQQQLETLMKVLTQHVSSSSSLPNMTLIVEATDCTNLMTMMMMMTMDDKLDIQCLDTTMTTTSPSIVDWMIDRYSKNHEQDDDDDEEEDDEEDDDDDDDDDDDEELWDLLIVDGRMDTWFDSMDHHDMDHHDMVTNNNENNNKLRLKKQNFVQALSNALGPYGMMSTIVPETMLLYQDYDHQNTNTNTNTNTNDSTGKYDYTFLSLLEESGFESVITYSNNHYNNHNYDNHNHNKHTVRRRNKSKEYFMVATRNRNDRATWFANEAEHFLAMQYVIARSSSSTASSSTATTTSWPRYMDSATLMALQFPHRQLEDAWCQLDNDNDDNDDDDNDDDDTDNDDNCFQRHGFDPSITNFPERTALRVDVSRVGKDDEDDGDDDTTDTTTTDTTSSIAGRGVFANQFIPAGSFLGLEECVNGMQIPAMTLDVLWTFSEHFNTNTPSTFQKEEKNRQTLDYWYTFYRGYVEGYGWQETQFGATSAAVDSGISTFCNHGCDRTYNMGLVYDFTESTFREQLMMTTMTMMMPWNIETVFFDPAYDRSLYLGCLDSVALVDIPANGELLDNYLAFGGFNAHEFMVNVEEVRQMCTGEGFRHVKEYEVGKS